MRVDRTAALIFMLDKEREHLMEVITHHVMLSLGDALALPDGLASSPTPAGPPPPTTTAAVPKIRSTLPSPGPPARSSAGTFIPLPR
jgi:hypothetical protein